MEKEEWIDKVMKSAGQLQPAEADSFLFMRLPARLDATELPVRLSVRRLAFAVAAILVLNMGCIAVKQRLDRQQAEEQAMASMGNEMGFNKSMNY